MKIITGYTGENHITPDNDASIHNGVIGAKNYVLNSLNNFGYQLMGNNIIRIRSGVMCYGGRFGVVESYEDLTFENGTQGVSRTDLLVARYAKDALTSIETMSLAIITGTSAAEAKALDTDFPLYKIKLDGVNVASVTPLFDVLVSMKELKTLIDSISQQLAATQKTVNTTVNDELAQVRREYRSADTELAGQLSQSIQSLKAAMNEMDGNLGYEIAFLKDKVAYLESKI